MRNVSKPPGRACIASLALCLFALSLVPTTLARSTHRRGKVRESQVRKVKRVAKPVAPGTVIQGKASWYGPGFHGRRTASGEPFSRHRMTLAHRGLPFGTRLEITNLKNGRKAVARVNDRGPHRRGRVVDLSEALARRLGINGVGPVRCVVLPSRGVGKQNAAVERKPRATPKGDGPPPALVANDTPCPVDTGRLFGPSLPAATGGEPAAPAAPALNEMARSGERSSGTAMP